MAGLWNDPHVQDPADLLLDRLEREQIELVRRNGLRLLKLVNALLDFSRLEAGKIQAHYEPIDIAAYTAELASTFQSAMDKAGLRYVIDCAPVAAPTFVDREMWEKIVLNLLSNALKFTPRGGKVELDGWMEPGGGIAFFPKKPTPETETCSSYAITPPTGMA